MSRLLHIETAVQVCSVAVSENGRTISIIEEFNSKSHATLLHVFIRKALDDAGFSLSELTAVSVSGGPGSYTGLRIGVSAAKGLCYGLDIPLIVVDTLQSMAFGLKRLSSNSIEKNIRFQPMIDAGRMEVYTQTFNADLFPQTEVRAEIYDETSFQNGKNKELTVIGGNGANKFSSFFSENKNFKFFPENIHSAGFSIKLATEKFNNNDFADLAYYEPFYLKEYIPGKSRVKGL